MTGITRFSSSSCDTAFAPGLVDSPPTSIIIAPFSIILSDRSIAAEKSSNTPSSEKLSGVTLSTPCIIGCSKLIVNLPFNSSGTLARPRFSSNDKITFLSSTDCAERKSFSI